MLPEPHNKPHSIASDVNVLDLGYASLYSRWVELYIYLVPVYLVLGALFGFIAYKAGASADTTLAITGIPLVVAKAAISLGFVIHPVYQTWKSAGTLSGTKTTAHVFTADGVRTRKCKRCDAPSLEFHLQGRRNKKRLPLYRDGKLTTFLPARHLEGPVEAELMRKFIRQKVADATLLG
jgi:hypothetical protein